MSPGASSPEAPAGEHHRPTESGDFPFSAHRDLGPEPIRGNGFGHIGSKIIMPPNQNTHFKIKNINKTSNRKCDCPNWLVHWRIFANSFREICAVIPCGYPAEVGAHVLISDGRYPNQWYVVPMCKKHNNYNNLDEMFIDCRILLVPASTALTCKSEITKHSDLKRCYSCRKPGHNIQTCPEIRRCNICNGYDHDARNCPNVSRCSICNGIGHNARTCPEARRCRICNGYDHDARTCPNR
jgi:protein AIR1/2